jgi:hypothetical protein
MESHSHSNSSVNGKSVNGVNGKVEAAAKVVEEVVEVAKRYGGPKMMEALAVGATIAGGLATGLALAEALKGLRRKPYSPPAPETVEQEALRRASAILASRMEKEREKEVEALVSKLLNKQQ